MATKVLDERDGNFQEIESELDSKAELSDLIGVKEEEGSSVEIGGNTYTVGSNAIKTGNTDINIAVGNNSIASGDNTVAFGNTSYAGGYQTAAIGDNSYVTGYSFAYPFDYINPDSTDEEIIEAWGAHKFSLAKGDYSFVSGACNLALGTEDSADGANNIACGGYSHASGTYTKASGAGSSTEGFRTKANGNFSRAIGNFTEANGEQSFTGGIGTVANGNSTAAIGRFNVNDTVDSDGEGDYAFIVGNGVDSDHKSNAYTLDWEGNAWFSKDVYVGSTSGTNKDAGSKKLVSEEVTGDLSDLATTDKTNLVNAVNELVDLKDNLKRCAMHPLGSSPIVHMPTLPTGYMGGGTIQYFQLSESGSFYNVYVNIGGNGTIEQGNYILDEQSPVLSMFGAPMPCLINGKAIGSIELCSDTGTIPYKMILKIPETINNVTSITFNSFVFSFPNSTSN